jgi:FkbM family methyltransferase
MRRLMNNETKRRLKRTLAYSLLEEARALIFLLKGWKRGSYAQHGEDRFLLQYFGRHIGTYIDVGANHPFVISNTYLLYRHGWRGLTIEPLPNLARKHVFWRPRDVSINAGIAEHVGPLRLHEFAPSGLSTFDDNQAKHLVEKGGVIIRTLEVEVATLADIYKRYWGCVPKVDLLCIDTEGMDLDVLRGNDFEG